MRVWLSTYGSRGDVEPMVGLAVHLAARDAEMRVCALPDFAELLARHAAELVECNAPVATGGMPGGVWR